MCERENFVEIYCSDIIIRHAETKERKQAKKKKTVMREKEINYLYRKGVFSGDSFH